MKNFLFGNNKEKHQAEIDSLKIELTKYQTTNSQLVAQLESVQEQLKRRETQLQDERGITDTLRKEKTELSSTIQKMQRDFDKLSKAKEEQVKREQFSNKQNRQLQLQLDGIKETKILLKTKLDQRDGELQELSATNKELNEKLVKIQKEVRAAKRSFVTAQGDAKLREDELRRDAERRLEVKLADIELMKIKQEKLQKNLEKIQAKNERTIQVYRGHLINAAKGSWDPSIKQTILEIFESGSSEQVSPQSNASSQKENMDLTENNNNTNLKRASRSGSILSKLQESTNIR